MNLTLASGGAAKSWGSNPGLPRPGAHDTRPRPRRFSPALVLSLRGCDAAPDPNGGLGSERLPSSRELSLVTESWLVRFLGLSLSTGLIGPGQDFLMGQLPPPSDWEFLWGWGQGTEPCSKLGPSTGSDPEEGLGVGLSDE